MNEVKPVQVDTVDPNFEGKSMLSPCGMPFAANTCEDPLHQLSTSYMFDMQKHIVKVEQGLFRTNQQLQSLVNVMKNDIGTLQTQIDELRSPDLNLTASPSFRDSQQLQSLANVMKNDIGTLQRQIDELRTTNPNFTRSPSIQADTDLKTYPASAQSPPSENDDEARNKDQTTREGASKKRHYSKWHSRGFGNKQSSPLHEAHQIVNQSPVSTISAKADSSVISRELRSTSVEPNASVANKDLQSNVVVGDNSKSPSDAGNKPFDKNRRSGRNEQTEAVPKHVRKVEYLPPHLR